MKDTEFDDLLKEAGMDPEADKPTDKLNDGEAAKASIGLKTTIQPAPAHPLAKQDDSRKPGHPTKFWNVLDEILKEYGTNKYNLAGAARKAGVPEITVRKWKEKNFNGFADKLHDVELSYNAWLWRHINHHIENGDTKVMMETAKAVIPQFRNVAKQDAPGINARTVNINIGFGDEDPKPLRQKKDGQVIDVEFEEK